MADFKRAQAKVLRRAETPAEKRLWKALRVLPVDGSHFRRQVPLGPYIADFACLSARLVIEVDGASHASAEGIAHDARRACFLEQEGYRILRFHNAEIFDNECGVIETIHAALHGRSGMDLANPSFTPPRTSGPTLPLKGRVNQT